jgi:hypothetical protein
VFVDPQRLPVTVSRDDALRICAELTVFEEAMTPVDPVWLSGRIDVMLRQFPDRGAAVPVEIMEKIIDDWLDALEGYPQWAVAEAVTGYLQSEKWKPAISEIVERCEAAVERTRAVLDGLKLLGERPVAPDENA